MKILYVITKADLGGAQVHLLDLISGLQDQADISVAVGEEGFFTESLDNLGVPYRVLPNLVHPIHPVKDLRAVDSLGRLIRETKPDLVHCHTSKAGMVGRLAAYLNGVPAIFTAHTWCFAENASRKWRLLGTPAERLVARCSGAIINVSDANRRLALKLGVGSERNLVTIHNGMPDTPHRATPGSDAVPIIFMAARFVPQKNQPALLRAVAQTSAPCQVWFAGDGPTRPAVEQLACNLGVRDRTVFLGERRDIAQLMAQSHIFALASNWEGFPLTILEAMRAGLPVVASNVGGVPEAVWNGLTGFVVPPGDVDSFSDRLDQLASNPVLRQRMGEEARSMYESRFTLNAMVQGTSALYRRIMAAEGETLDSAPPVLERAMKAHSCADAYGGRLKQMHTPTELGSCEMTPVIAPALERHDRLGRPFYATSLLVLADITALLLSVGASLCLKILVEPQLELTAYLRLWPFVFVFVAVYAVVGLYSGISRSPPEELRRATLSSSFVFLTAAAATVSLRRAEQHFTWNLIIAIVLSIIFVPLLRGCVRRYAGSKDWWGFPAVVFGAGETGQSVVQALKAEPWIGLRPIAILDDTGASPSSISGVPVIRSAEALSRILDAYSGAAIYAVVTAGAAQSAPTVSLMEDFGNCFSRALVIPDVHGCCSMWASTKTVGGMLGLEVNPHSWNANKRLTKRMLDLAITGIGSILMAPLVIAIAICIKVDSRGPIVYGQRRIGKGGREFTAWKFRTMVVNAEQALQSYLDADPDRRREWEEYFKLKDDPRVTRVGKYLRRTSLDELPQLWNVLRGEMSLVGPRPIVKEEVPKYGGHFTLYTRVLGGLTGMWQVSGRNDTTYEARVSLDTFYVRNWSVWLDLCILVQTLRAVLFRKGAY